MTSQHIFAIGETVIGVVKDDLTTMQYVDAVVNAANETLLGGGGVDGAIHRAAGPELLKECRTLNGCRTGEAKMTGAYDMPCRHIIHTVGPVWRGGDSDEADLLASCYRNSLQTAVDNGISTIAFPSISTGIFSYPLEEAAFIAVHTVMDFAVEHPREMKLVLWACIDDRTQMAYQRALEQASEEQGYEMYPGLMIFASEEEVGEAIEEMDHGFGSDDGAPSLYLS